MILKYRTSKDKIKLTKIKKSMATDGNKGNQAFTSLFLYKLFFGVTKKIIKVFFIGELQF